jgi:hypothetical protein
MQTITIEIPMFEKKIMKIGDQVVPSGLGKTINWRIITGLITEITNTKVFVKWDGTSFEDELEKHEVELFNSNLVLRFTDRVQIYTGGELRLIEEIDGFYVTGRCRLIPVRYRQEGIEIISQIKENEKSKFDELIKVAELIVEISLSDLIKLNKISIQLEYNQNLVDDFSDELNEDSRFQLRPLIIHRHKKGIRCEPHIRYMGSGLFPNNNFTFLLDLPLGDIGIILRQIS